MEDEDEPPFPPSTVMGISTGQATEGGAGGSDRAMSMVTERCLLVTRNLWLWNERIETAGPELANHEQTDIVPTRRALQRTAAHVLGRRRFQVGGRFGLRASPGGFATPAFGEEPEVVRVAGTLLVREVGGHVATMPMNGASLGELAAFAGADLGVPFAPGGDGPELGNPDDAFELDAGAARRIADWFDLGWRVLDEVLGHQPREAAPATVQLWPEHFDIGTNLALPSGEGRVNLGFSPGDDYEPEPYAYVGPWGEERHGDPSFWNAPFGAVLTASRVRGAEPDHRCAEFLRDGIRHAASR